MPRSGSLRRSRTLSSSAGLMLTCWPRTPAAERSPRGTRRDWPREDRTMGDDEDTGGTGPSMEERLARLEGKLDAIAAQRSSSSGTHQAAERTTGRVLDRDSSIEARVQEEVSRLRRHQEEADERKASAAHRSATEERLSKL